MKQLEGRYLEGKWSPFDENSDAETTATEKENMQPPPAKRRKKVAKLVKAKEGSQKQQTNNKPKPNKPGKKPKEATGQLNTCLHIVNTLLYMYMYVNFLVVAHINFRVVLLIG